MATIEQIAFSMISSAGDAQSMQLEALTAARGGDFVKAEKLMHDAEGILLKAHHEQTELIKQEANGQKADFSILLVHAQDHLMNGVLAKKLIAEMIQMYKEIKG